MPDLYRVTYMRDSAAEASSEFHDRLSAWRRYAELFPDPEIWGLIIEPCSQETRDKIEAAEAATIARQVVEFRGRGQVEHQAEIKRLRAYAIEQFMAKFNRPVVGKRKQPRDGAGA